MVVFPFQSKGESCASTLIYCRVSPLDSSPRDPPRALSLSRVMSARLHVIATFHCGYRAPLLGPTGGRTLEMLGVDFASGALYRQVTRRSVSPLRSRPFAHRTLQTSWMPPSLPTSSNGEEGWTVDTPTHQLHFIFLFSVDTKKHEKTALSYLFWINRPKETFTDWRLLTVEQMNRCDVESPHKGFGW